MIRMLIVGYVFALRSERRICAEVQVNLAYRWFCKLGIEDSIPDHSVFCRARHECFRHRVAAESRCWLRGSRVPRWALVQGDCHPISPLVLYPSSPDAAAGRSPGTAQ